jgi:hypothetical protein
MPAPDGLNPLLAVRDLVVPALDLLIEGVEVVPRGLELLEEVVHHRPGQEGALVRGVPGVSQQIRRSSSPPPWRATAITLTHQSVLARTLPREGGVSAELRSQNVRGPMDVRSK